ncbi:DNA polymerase-3 subunit delta' [Weissella uvarum]|uniref:DNA polymerase III subunit delta' n=1 Tax=Weissella uvarum TaxID=1479233 RepID=UPI00196026F1|nr:DNA polymerase III subunit delta' [Weissella uvarum]MBM7616792.1 DNA polymerase-3 subunit delta' [Weissella uvarum]MCM0594754.1 DNA polymerase III subunit delta' [Weissella uvarum]
MAVENTPETLIAQANAKQPVIIHQFESAIKKQQLSHAFLFVGPNGRGQVEVADWLAMRLLCLHPQADGNPDGTCNQCRRIARHEHPDVVEVEPDGQRLKVDQIRFLQNELTKTAVEGEQKVIIVHAAETMTDSAANGLLKSIEEPQGHQTIILIATSRQQVLPTIVSRTQVVEFQALAGEARNQQLLDLGYPQHVVPLVSALTDDLDVAQNWLVDDWFQRVLKQVERLMTALLEQDYQAFVMIQTDVMPLIKEQDAKAVLAMIIQACRDLLMALQGGLIQSGFTTLPQWEQLAKRYTQAQILALTDLALAMPQAIEMNLNTQTVIESFVIKSQKVLAG